MLLQRTIAVVSPLCIQTRTVKFIQLYIQQDATLHSLSLETALHVSGGISTHHQERIQLYLHHLVLLKPLLLPVDVVEEMERQFQLFRGSDR